MSALDPKYYDALKDYRSELIKCIDVNDILGEMTTLRPNDEERIRAQLDVSGRTTQSACMDLLVHIRRRGKECFFDFLLALKQNKCIEVLNKVINRANCRDDWEKYCETKSNSKGEFSQTCKEEGAAAEPTSMDVKKKQAPISKHTTKGRITGEIIVGQDTEKTIITLPQVEPPQVIVAQPDVGGCLSVSLCDVEWNTLMEHVQKVECLKLAKKFSLTGRELSKIKKSADQADTFVDILIDKADEKGWTMETLQSHIKSIDKQEPLKQSIQAVDEKSMQALPSYEDVVGINTSKPPSSFITEEASERRPKIGMNISKETPELPIIDKSHIQKKSGDVDDNVDFQVKNFNSLSGKDNVKKNFNSTEPNRKQTITCTVGGAKSAGLTEKKEFSSNAEDMEQRLEPVASVDFHEGLKPGKAAENLNQELTTGLPSAQASAVADKPEPVASVEYEDTGERLKTGDELNAAENVGEHKFAVELNTGGREHHAGVQASATVETWEPEPVTSVDYEGTSEGLKAGDELNAAENISECKFAKELNTGGGELHAGVQASATVETWEPEPVACSLEYAYTDGGLKAGDELNAVEKVSEHELAEHNTGGKEDHGGVQASATVKNFEPESAATLDYQDTGEGLKAGEELEAAENLIARETQFSDQELNTAGEELSAMLQGTTIAESFKPKQASSNVNEHKFPNQEVNTAAEELHRKFQASATVKTWEPESVDTLDYEDTGEGLKAGEELQAAEILNLGKHKLADKEINPDSENLHASVQASDDSWELDPSELTELSEADS